MAELLLEVPGGGGGWTIAVVDGGASWVVGARGSGCVTVTCAIPRAVVPKVDGAWDEAAVVGSEDLVD